MDGRPDYVLLLAFLSSTLSSGLIARYAWRRRRAWLARVFDRGDRLVLLFAGVLAANSVISYAYTKDVIMSPAGVFFAAALYVAVRDWMETAPPTRAAIARTAAVLLVVSGTWNVRALGLHAALMETSRQVREQWAYIDNYLPRYDALPPTALALKRQLQEDAIVTHPGRPMLRDEWKRFFEIE